jgi:glycerol-3-phosphate dehydrogenase
MATVSVLGSGIMATALSFPLSDNGHEVRLVGTHLDREIIDSIKETGLHPGLELFRGALGQRAIRLTSETRHDDDRRDQRHGGRR